MTKSLEHALLLLEKAMRTCQLAIGLLLMMSMSGCVSHSISGRPIDPVKVDCIRDGVTTENEVLQLLGLCSQKTPKSPDGEQTWVYDYTDTKTVATPGLFVPSFHCSTKMKCLYIRLKNGVVVSHELKDAQSD